MWKYDQASGALTDPNGEFEARGYSGAALGKNNPDMENVPCVGPIPVGSYTLGEPFDSPEHGPFAMPLTPDPANEMFGRSGFLMHGDSLEHPGCASEGCIIMPPGARAGVWASGDRELEVV
jgi:hypothetical protein